MSKKKNPVLDWFLDLRLVKYLYKKSKVIVLPGFDKIPFFDVMIFFLRGLSNGRIVERGSAIAFSFFLALFPAILFFFTLLPVIPFESLQENLMQIIKDSLPLAVYDFVHETLDEIINRKNSGLLSLGFVLALFFASNGFKGLLRGFDSSYHNDDIHNFWYMQYMSLFMVVVFSFIAIISIVLMMSYKFILAYLVDIEFIKSDTTYFIAASVNWLLTVLMVYALISMTYYLGAPKREKFKFFSAGSSFATILYIISFLGFDYYINNFSRYNALYGSIGTIIIILLWIYLVSIILLIGYELNISIKQAKRDSLNPEKVIDSMIDEDQ